MRSFEGAFAGPVTDPSPLHHHHQEITMSRNSDLVSCTACGGYTEFDDEGREYTCFRCCNTGFISRAAAELEEIVRESEHALYVAETAARRKALGVPDGYGYYFDEYEGDIVLVPPPSERIALPLHCVDSDLPF
jgi:hypothetical protein